MSQFEGERFRTTFLLTLTFVPISRGHILKFLLTLTFVLILQDEYSSAPSTLARSNPSCAICRSSEASLAASGGHHGGQQSVHHGGHGGHHSAGVVRQRSGYASVGTSTRIDSLQQQYSTKSRKPPPAIAPPQVPNKRPFQHVEKICSLVMALLFLLFNAIYWPWLLRDEDFDYAKFKATQQQQIKF